MLAKMPQGTLVSKEKKWAPGFKARRDSLLLLVCGNAVGFTIRTALICKAVNPHALNRNKKHQLPLLWLYNKKAWTIRTLFLDWFHRRFAPEVKKYLASKRLSFKVFFWYWTMPLITQKPYEFNTKGIKMVYLPPNIMSPVQPVDQGVMRTSLCTVLYGKDCQC